MIKVGITGGIGSGKTYVCKLFDCMGIPVYDADQRAKKLMTSNKILKNAIISLLGREAYFLNGRLNRKYIAESVFKNAKLLQSLNALVHPAVAKDGEEWFNQAEKQGHKYAVKEAALLIESQSYKLLDKLIVVTAPLELRISRVMKRDKSTRENVLTRISKQMSDDEKIKFADFTIVNDGEKSVIEQVKAIHDSLMSLSS
jgi:dephospho-CoA kinase